MTRKSTKVEGFSSRTEVEQLVSEHVDFCNFKRIPLKNGLAPVEFRNKAV